MTAGYRGPAVFLPGDPPRAGLVALLESDSAARAAVSLVLPLDAGPRRTRLPATVVALRGALPWLATLDPDGVDPSLAVLALAVRAGMTMVARGRLHPSWTRSGADCWRAGPLDGADVAWAAALCAAVPVLWRAVPAGPTDDRVLAPAALLRECWDAVADTMVRTAAADMGRGTLPFASRVPVPTGRLRGWLEAIDPLRAARAQAGIRLELPDDPGRPATAVAFVRSTVDPAVVADASAIASLDGEAALRLGPAPALDLLEGLRRAAGVSPAVGALLDAPFPDRVEIDDDALEDLVGAAATRLARIGVEVAVPEGLEAAEPLELAAVLDDATGFDEDGLFSLASICEFRWVPTIGGEPLTDEEVELLRAATRPLIRLRGRWVRTDPGVRERLTHGGGRIRAGQALAGALAGSLDAGTGAAPVRAGPALLHMAEEIRTMGSGDPIAAPDGLSATLRPYQLRGLGWLAATCRLGLGGCLADDMGLGKTVQVIALHLHRSAGPMLVVCPASMLGTWERELHRFAPSLQVRRYHGGERHLSDLAATEVVLVTYAVARRDAGVLAEVRWDLLVADEAQHVKNPASAGARALRTIGARARVALTGTPVENRLTDLWAILDLTTPGLLGSLDAFRRRVARPIEREHDDEVARRFSRTIRPFVLRRRKSDPDVAPELPPKTEVDVVVDLTAEQAALYEGVVADTLAAIRGSRGMARRGLVLRLLTALKQVCNHPAHYLGQDGPIPGRSGKIDALDELLDVILAEGEATLVFTQYVAMARLLDTHLRARGILPAFLHGALPVRRRDDLVRRFQEGEFPVFLLSLRAGGVGLTLTRATHVVHYDRWWNPAVEDQATDRTHRIGQESPVEIHRLVTEGTLEDRIGALLERKRALADRVLGSGEAWISELSDDELADLVALQRAG